LHCVPKINGPSKLVTLTLAMAMDMERVPVSFLISFGRLTVESSHFADQGCWKWKMAGGKWKCKCACNSKWNFVSNLTQGYNSSLNLFREFAADGNAPKTW